MSPGPRPVLVGLKTELVIPLQALTVLVIVERASMVAIKEVPLPGVWLSL